MRRERNGSNIDIIILRSWWKRWMTKWWWICLQRWWFSHLRSYRCRLQLFKENIVHQCVMIRKTERRRFLLQTRARGSVLNNKMIMKTKIMTKKLMKMICHFIYKMIQLMMDLHHLQVHFSYIDFAVFIFLM